MERQRMGSLHIQLTSCDQGTIFEASSEYCVRVPRMSPPSSGMTACRPSGHRPRAWGVDRAMFAQPALNASVSVKAIGAATVPCVVPLR